MMTVGIVLAALALPAAYFGVYALVVKRQTTRLAHLRHAHSAAVRARRPRKGLAALWARLSG
jgi:hypothetical protein